MRSDRVVLISVARLTLAGTSDMPSTIRHNSNKAANRLKKEALKSVWFMLTPQKHRQ